MKRIVVLLLIAMFSFSIAIGEDSSKETATNPILFRNIPWGTSVSEFMSLIKEKADISLYGYDVYDNTYMYSWEFNPDISPVGIDRLGYIKDAGYRLAIYGFDTDLMVGGFKVKSIHADFMFGFDDNGVYKEKDQSMLYKASYDFDVIEVKTAYDILKGKLESLYGIGETGNDTCQNLNYDTINADWTVWYGADDTGVFLWYRKKVDKNNNLKEESITLEYGKTNSLTVLQELESAISREQIKEATQSNDTDGL